MPTIDFDSIPISKRPPEEIKLNAAVFQCYGLLEADGIQLVGSPIRPCTIMSDEKVRRSNIPVTGPEAPYYLVVNMSPRATGWVAVGIPPEVTSNLSVPDLAGMMAAQVRLIKAR